jgi:hypothetical protein
MKARKFSRRLELNKETITHLTGDEQRTAKAGNYQNNSFVIIYCLTYGPCTITVCVPPSPK